MADHLDDGGQSDPILLRVGGWGTAAAVALGAFAFAAQSDAGGKRLQFALEGTLSNSAYPAAVAVAVKPDPTLTQLEGRVDRLASDRVQIDARLSKLEHGLDDVTGSIRRETQVRVAPRRPPQRFIEPPVIPKVETLPAASAVKAASIAPQTEAAPAPSAPPEAQPEAIPTDVPMPRPRPAMHLHPTHAEYGLELGTASDVEALRGRWIAIKANFGPLLVGMSPVGVKDRRPGSTKLRLIAGPVKNMAAARELCARFVAMNGYCWPTRVDATDVVMR